ncbi:hypothetical protein L6452_06619 [Arctium lappa]|uniref:Uncharacterized protein n=1 Tax=Arctium lappa TaxID=4217 RepID=A0ACB9EK10_ARCLA|nr:hypothetical protein L6452_06619 [Arctium lappa]
MKAPEITFWDTLRDNGKDFFRIKRADGSFEAFSTWGRVIRSCSRADIEEMYKVGMKLYEPVLKGNEENLLKVAMEYLCMMFNPERVAYRIKDHNHEFVFKKIDKWILFENCGVYMITIDNCYHEYYLVDKIYEHSKEKLVGMLKAKLVCTKDSEMAKIMVRRTVNQSLGLDPNLVEVNAAGTKLILLFKISTVGVTTAKRLILLSMVSAAELSTAQNIKGNEVGRSKKNKDNSLNKNDRLSSEPFIPNSCTSDSVILKSNSFDKHGFKVCSDKSKFMNFARKNLYYKHCWDNSFTYYSPPKSKQNKRKAKLSFMSNSNSSAQLKVYRSKVANPTSKKHFQELNVKMVWKWVPKPRYEWRVKVKPDDIPELFDANREGPILIWVPKQN